MVRTTYGTGPYIIKNVMESCECPSFTDTLSFPHPPASRSHSHLECKTIDGKGGFYLNGFDDDGNSVWNFDRVIVCSEETTLLTMCCNNLLL